MSRDCDGLRDVQQCKSSLQAAWVQASCPGAETSPQAPGVWEGFGLKALVPGKEGLIALCAQALVPVRNPAFSHVAQRPSLNKLNKLSKLSFSSDMCTNVPALQAASSSK